LGRNKGFRSAKRYKFCPGKNQLIKKAERLSQYSGPTSTYEKQPFRRAQILIQKQCQLNKHLNQAKLAVYLSNR